VQVLKPEAPGAAYARRRNGYRKLGRPPRPAGETAGRTHPRTSVVQNRFPIRPFTRDFNLLICIQPCDAQKVGRYPYKLKI